MTHLETGLMILEEHMAHRFTPSQLKYVEAMFRQATSYLFEADEEAVNDWAQAAKCIYGHMQEDGDEGPAMRMMQIAVASQVLESLLGHLSYGGEIMRRIDGPMAALVVHAYSELPTADSESEVLWPQTIG
jgi:hypothetical protein